jgi:hypothetical protein
MEEYDEEHPQDYGYDEYDDNTQSHALYEKLSDFDKYLKQLIMEWLGMYWNDNEQRYVRDKRVTPIMNIKGARWCITFLRTYARDNNILTRVGEKSFKFLMQDVVKTAWLNIGTRAREFNIKNNGDILAVCNQLIHTTELVLIGALGNKTYIDSISGSYKYNEGGHIQRGGIPTPQQPQRRGIIGGIKRFVGLR